MTDTLVDKTKIIEESGRLVDQLRAIEEVLLHYFKIDKKAAYKEVFEAHREKSSLLDRAIKGEINIAEEYEAFLKEFAGARNFYPHYHSNEEYKRRLNDLVSIIGYFGIGDVSNVVANTTVVGGVGTVCAGIKETIRQRLTQRSIDRRKFLMYLFPTAFFVAGLGNICSIVKSSLQHEGRKDVYYAQSKINEAYNL